MSYILEALKKLEEKRRLETGPYLLSSHYSSPQKRKGYFQWRYLIFFALLLNAGILLWWAGPWLSKNNAERSTFEGQGQSTVNKQLEIVKDAIDEGPGPRHRQPRNVVENGHTVGSGPQENALAPSFQTGPSAPDKAGPDSKIIEMSDLPSSVRQKLPDLNISGHFYESTPSSRIITVGGRTLHEGASAAPGVKLERITSDGAIFSCDGYRFHKGVF